MTEFPASRAERLEPRLEPIVKFGRFLTRATQREQKAALLNERREEQLVAFRALREQPDRQAEKIEMLAGVIAAKLEPEEPIMERTFKYSAGCRICIFSYEPQHFWDDKPGTAIIRLRHEKSELEVAELSLTSRGGASSNASNFFIPLNETLATRSEQHRENIFAVLQEIEHLTFERWAKSPMRLPPAADQA